MWKDWIDAYAQLFNERTFSEHTFYFPSNDRVKSSVINLHLALQGNFKHYTQLSQGYDQCKGNHNIDAEANELKEGTELDLNLAYEKLEQLRFRM